MSLALIPEPSPFKFNVEEALKSGLYTSGTTGCGKTDVAMYCVDQLRKAGVYCAVFDPSQDWLRRYPASNVVTIDSISSIDKIHLKSATILDISSLTVPQTQEIVERFCQRIFEFQARTPIENRKKIMIIFEEAHTEFPQGILRAKRMQNAVRLLTQGRNFNIRMGMITQFAALIDKSAIRYMTQRFFGWSDEKNDLDFISSFIGEETAQNLKYLPSGDFIYSFPRENILEKIHIEPYGR